MKRFKIILGTLLLIVGQNKSMDPILEKHLFLKRHEEILEKINQCKVMGVFQNDRVVKVGLLSNKEGGKPFAAHFFIHFNNRIPYLTPIIPIINDNKTLAQLGKDYALIDGTWPKLRCALQEGADINACDKRYKPLTFTLFAPDGTIYLAKNQKTVIIPAPYAADTHEFTAYKLANYYGNFDISRELVTRFPQHFSQQDKDNVGTLLSQLKEDSQKLIEAQKTFRIPSFSVDPQVIVPNDREDCLRFWNNNDISFAAFVNKDQVTLKALTPSSSWRSNYLGFGSLSALYSRIICLNEREGNNIIATFDAWKHHLAFTQRVLQHAADFIEMQSYRDDTILMGNLVKLAECIIYKDNMKQRFHEKYVALLLSFCVTKIQTSDVREKEEYYKSAYNMLFRLLIQKEEGKSFLKKLCDEEYNKALLPTMVFDIKAFMHNSLLKNVLVRTLSARENPLLTKDAACEVAARWQPDEEFKSYFRK